MATLNRFQDDFSKLKISLTFLNRKHIIPKNRGSTISCTSFSHIKDAPRRAGSVVDHINHFETRAING